MPSLASAPSGMQEPTEMASVCSPKVILEKSPNMRILRTAEIRNGAEAGSLALMEDILIPADAEGLWLG